MTYKKSSPAQKSWITRRGKKKIKKTKVILLTVVLITSVLGTINKRLETKNVEAKEIETKVEISYSRLPESGGREMMPEEKYYYLLKTDENFRRYINSISVLRNNPGNLRCAGQPNSTCVNGFANFPNIILGFRALIKQAELDQSRSFTLKQFISKYSPSHENDTPHLINRAEEETKISRDENINKLDTIRLAQIMTKQEWSIKY